MFDFGIADVRDPGLAEGIDLEFQDGTVLGYEETGPGWWAPDAYVEAFDAEVEWAFRKYEQAKAETMAKVDQVLDQIVPPNATTPPLAREALRVALEYAYRIRWHVAAIRDTDETGLAGYIFGGPRFLSWIQRHIPAVYEPDVEVLDS